MRFFLTSVFSLALTCLAAPYAKAQQLDNIYRDWSVFTITQQGKKVCYIASAPKKKAGNYSRRSEPYMLVTHVKPEVDEVSASSGYPYKKGSEVEAVIDQAGKYKMFTKGELAWAYDSTQDAKMVRAMKKGNRITIRGNSRRGTYSLDTYSLQGFTKAYQRMKSLCK